MGEHLALHWRLIPHRYNLIGTECVKCGEKFFPPRHFCPNCRRKGETKEFLFSGEGEIFSHTTVYAPPEGFEYQKPYVLAIVKLKEGPFILSQIVDCRPEDVKVGGKVKATFRKIIADGDDGIIRYGYKFKLVA